VAGDNTNGWTVETLREYVLRLLDEQEKRVRLALDAAQRSVDKSEEAQGRYNAVSNEFRGQLSDQAAMFMPRAEAESGLKAFRSEVFAKFDALEKRADELQRRADKTEGKSIGSAAVIGFIVTAIGVIGGIIAIIVAVQ
jgi:hypothetical protein